jgi:hypothetical protein
MEDIRQALISIRRERSAAEQQTKLDDINTAAPTLLIPHTAVWGAVQVLATNSDKRNLRNPPNGSLGILQV